MTTTPVLTRTRAELAEALAALPGTTALVMTMGALHEGHLELVRQGQALADHVIVTIFVNPTQFAPGEDFDTYPRTLDADMAALSRVGADLVWAPEPNEVYLSAPRLTIDPGPVAHILEGITRPTHFAGVALVVTKGLLITRPTVALFGHKDAQQLAVIRSVATDLDLPAGIHGVDIVRDTDGVALSSRNQYLSEAERIRARALSRGLTNARATASHGASPLEVLDAARRELAGESGITIDYVAIVEDESFTPLIVARGNAQTTVDALVDQEGPFELRTSATLSTWGPVRRARLLVAAKVGTTRLIDNTELNLPVTSTEGAR